MDLVPVFKKGVKDAAAVKPASKAALSEFSVPVERQQQIGVTYAAAEKKPLHHTIRSVGMVVPDKTRHWEFVARVEGYVQKLHVTSPGEPIKEGQPLLTIYSPELLTAQQEFLNARRWSDRPDSQAPIAHEASAGLADDARKRLELLGIAEEDIAALEKTGKPTRARPPGPGRRADPRYAVHRSRTRVESREGRRPRRSVQFRSAGAGAEPAS